MTLSEILHYHEWKRPSSQSDYAGGLTEGDLDEIKDWMH